ncbi:uncharacterized protein CTRU02_201513 [Colletotrichum truncatum]|uniref:Uncharacterized protein n=1 Tax=Colletotrichum truncatum TaxID=5467 RepID=A0ACC3ZHM5_COLTU|nr:uncharacterized protein CTRU02_10740 [Colletotrichum truncatum]KAF6786616.1 hypothetical protein CTRU02_10740 [Colletotrichum truncatum]
MANTIPSFGSASFRSLFWWLLLHVILIGASPTPNNVLTKRVRTEFREFANDYEGRVEKGQYLRDLFPLDDEKAAEYNGGKSVVSPFQDPVAVTRNGWSTYIFPYPFDQKGALDPSYGNILDAAFADKDLPVDQKESTVYYYMHNRRFLKDGQFKEQPTKAVYSNVVVPASGAFIFDENYSPKYRQGQLKEGDIPDLDTLSDIAYFQWRDGCQVKSVPTNSLKVIFRSHISHKGTYDYVVQALEEADYKRVPGWADKAVFSMESRQGQAILGTVHGSGTAWMLIQHKQALGLKKISEVAVFGHGTGFDFKQDPNGKYANLNLRFTIEDV